MKMISIDDVIHLNGVNSFVVLTSVVCYTRKTSKFNTFPLKSQKIFKVETKSLSQKTIGFVVNGIDLSYAWKNMNFKFGNEILSLSKRSFIHANSTFTKATKFDGWLTFVRAMFIVSFDSMQKRSRPMAYNPKNRFLLLTTETIHQHKFYIVSLLFRF